VLLNGLKEDDIIRSKEKLVKGDPEQLKKEFVEQIIRSLQWFFGWMPRTQVKQIGLLRNHFNVGKAPDSDDDLLDGEQPPVNENDNTAVDSSTTNLKEGGRRS